MEIKFILSIQQLVGALIVIAGSFSVNTYMTVRSNKKIEILEEKCNEMMKETLARETFVPIELYKNEVHHLNKTLDEVKKQNIEILRCVSK